MNHTTHGSSVLDPNYSEFMMFYCTFFLPILEDFQYVPLRNVIQGSNYMKFKLFTHCPTIYNAITKNLEELPYNTGEYQVCGKCVIFPQQIIHMSPTGGIRGLHCHTHGKLIFVYGSQGFIGMSQHEREDNNSVEKIIRVLDFLCKICL